MGVIVFSGAACGAVVDYCKGIKPDLSPKVTCALYAAEILCTIAAVVLGILALLKILPLPVGMAEPFAYATMTAGLLNLFIMVSSTVMIKLTLTL